MNATELADALDWVCENHLTGIGDADFKATATMLRQQQAEIDLLRTTQPNIDYDKELLKPTFVGRELTNEEIMEVANEVFNNYKNWGYYQIDFARAILRKAQEK